LEKENTRNESDINLLTWKKELLFLLLIHGTKSRLWTMDWTMDWTVDWTLDSIIDIWTRILIARGKRSHQINQQQSFDVRQVPKCACMSIT